MPNRWKAYINGNVLTMDPAGTTATAFMTWAGRFVRVGNDDEIKAFINGTMDVVDLGGRTVLPGFIEPHNHFSAYAMNLMRVDCSVGANRSIAELKDRIRSRAVAAAPGEWIQGYGYDDSLIEDKRHLTREDLDEAAPDNPVQILHISVHFSYVNSRALEIAGIGAGTPSPANGQIHKDALGRPTGLLIEPGAMEMVMGRVPLFSTDQVKTAMLQAAGDLHRVGITGIHDGGIGYFKHGRQVVEAYGGPGTGRASAFSRLHDPDRDPVWRSFCQRYSHWFRFGHAPDRVGQILAGRLHPGLYRRLGPSPTTAVLIFAGICSSTSKCSIKWSPNTTAPAARWPCTPTATGPSNRFSRLLRTPIGFARKTIDAI